ncbi:MAG: DUF1015 domain-containing protein [Chloroflexi bacterium]|nr:DUF1015 domain-containing protein [Chloroflexota bacterium]
MVETLPFCGIRYAPRFSKPEVFAPPYDVISAELRDTYTARDAHNITHIDVTPAGAGLDWYDQAASQLNSWIRQGVLAQDDTPMYYGYVQHFRLADQTTYTRRGIFAAVRLAAWGEGIYRHEHTRSAPRADRLNLMRATRAQLSPVFGMFSDPELQLSAWLQPPPAAAVNYTDQEGTQQIFWPLAAPSVIANIQAFLADKEIVIADGHHRYETALAYRDERRAAEGNPSRSQPYDYVLMYVTALQDPGLCILPTHRVVTISGMPSLPTLRQLLSANLAITDAAHDAPLASLIRPLDETGTAFGIYLGKGTRWICRLKDSSSGNSAQTSDSADEQALDVSILQDLVLEPCFGIDAGALQASERVYYTISEAEACARVDSGQAQAAFILNPTRLAQVWQTARQLQTMPQKSTYFYPKLLTGLVMHTL